MGTTSTKPFMVAMQFLWDKQTPLGVPVEPEVYIIIAISSPLGGTFSREREKRKNY